MTVEEILPTLIRDKPFYDVSGGGVSFSGGEPTLFMEFAGRLLQALKSNGVRTLLQTCGLFNLRPFDGKMYPWLDTIYFDLKIFDRENHARYCGAGNEVILANFRELARRSHDGGVPLIPRTPLIPGITDTTENLQAIAAFLVECDVHQAKLLPYHPLWQEKNRMLGLQAPIDESPEMQKWLERENLVRSKAIFKEAGVEV